MGEPLHCPRMNPDLIAPGNPHVLHAARLDGRSRDEDRIQHAGGRVLLSTAAGTPSLATCSDSAVRNVGLAMMTKRSTHGA